MVIDERKGTPSAHYLLNPLAKHASMLTNKENKEIVQSITEHLNGLTITEAHYILQDIQDRLQNIIIKL